MDSLTKLLGLKCQIIAASGATSVIDGYSAYGCNVRVANTQILSVTKIENDTGVSAAVTGETWENVALLLNEYVPFEDPITSITLVSGTPGVMLYLQPRLG